MSGFELSQRESRCRHSGGAYSLRCQGDWHQPGPLHESDHGVLTLEICTATSTEDPGLVQTLSNIDVDVMSVVAWKGQAVLASSG